VKDFTKNDLFVHKNKVSGWGNVLNVSVQKFIYIVSKWKEECIKKYLNSLSTRILTYSFFMLLHFDYILLFFCSRLHFCAAILRGLLKHN